MLNDIVLNSIIVTIETLTYRKSIADKLISGSHGYQLTMKLKRAQTELGLSLAMLASTGLMFTEI